MTRAAKTTPQPILISRLSRFSISLARTLWRALMVSGFMIDYSLKALAIKLVAELVNKIDILTAHFFNGDSAGSDPLKHGASADFFRVVLHDYVTPFCCSHCQYSPIVHNVNT